MFIPALQISFVVLKLTDHIDWSWWMVMSPFIVTCLFVVIKESWIEFYLKSGRKSWKKKSWK